MVIPYKLRSRMLDELHRDHLGVTRMKAIARSYLWWPSLDKELDHTSLARQKKAHPQKYPCTPAPINVAR